MENNLTKAEIISNISANTGISKTETKVTLESFFEELKNGLKKGQSIEIRGLGTFEVRIRKGREKARNPKTGETVFVERHGVAAFRAGKDLQDALWTIDEKRS